MFDNSVSRTIAGVIAIGIGLFIVWNIVGEQPDGWIYIVCWGLGFVGVGIAIFFNKTEDDIEEIKSNKK